MPESACLQRDASLVQVTALLAYVRKFFRVDCPHFKKVLAPYETAPDFAYGNLALYRLLDNIAPFHAIGSAGTLVCPYLVHREHAQQTCCTPEVVQVRVRYYECVEPLHAYVVQERYDNVLAGIGSALVARIDKYVAVSGSAQQDAVSLPYIDDSHAPGGVKEPFVSLKAENSGECAQAYNAEEASDGVLAAGRERDEDSSQKQEDCGTERPDGYGCLRGIGESACQERG